MSNVSLKKERGCAQVWWEVTTTGRLRLRLTTPVRSRAFFALCVSSTAGKATVMAVPRTELQSELHRLANYIECQLVEIFRELVVEGRLNAGQSIVWNANQFIEALRDARDEKEGDE
jgi:hypothetical protein